jgi:hypothetical protein
MEENMFGKNDSGLVPDSGSGLSGTLSGELADSCRGRPDAQNNWEPAHEIFLKFLPENFDKGNRWLTRLIKKLDQTSGNRRSEQKRGARQSSPP